MASEPDTTEQEATEQQEKGKGGNGSNGSARKTAITAAALAAATGATAFAAKKVLSDRNAPRSRGDDGEEGGGKGQGSESLVTSMVTSGWDAARDSLLPLAEDAASRAGEFVATSAPEIVRDTLVPRFIEGFEQSRKSDD
jgi:hypothetical protein